MASSVCIGLSSPRCFSSPRTVVVRRPHLLIPMAKSFPKTISLGYVGQADVAERLPELRSFLPGCAHVLGDRPVICLRVEVVEHHHGSASLRRADLPYEEATPRVAFVDEPVVPVGGPVAAAEVRATARALLRR